MGTLILTEDGGMVDARITVGNTGLLRNQGHLRANRWSSIDSPILFALTEGPVMSMFQTPVMLSGGNRTAWPIRNRRQLDTSGIR